MNYNLITEFQEHLDVDEKLLWTGQPKKGIVFRTTDLFFLPFSLLFFGFAIFWFTTAITEGVPLLFAMFGIPFIVFGFILVFGRFIIDAKQRESTFYGLTEYRIIIKSGIFKKTIKSINIRTLSSIEYDEKSDGSGTISIGSENPIRGTNAIDSWLGIPPTPSLDLIQDVRQVYKKIIEIQRTK